MPPVCYIAACKYIAEVTGIAKAAFGDSENAARNLRNKVRKGRPLTTDESVAIEKVLAEAGITLGNSL